MPFRVQTDIYSGPLDLLLYLVRKQEIDLTQIPVARVTDQYLEQVAVLEAINVDAVGDFLDLASTLIEIKSRLVLPHPEQEEESEVEDPRHELVQRLLQFKKFREAAQQLEERGREWQDRFTRQASDLSGRKNDLSEQPIAGVELWDLVSAFGRVLREKIAPPAATTIAYDETPIHVFMEQIDQRVRQQGEITFFELFPEAVHKSTLVGMFLALLEMVRYRHLLAEQPERYGDIWLTPGPEPLQPSGHHLKQASEESPAESDHQAFSPRIVAPPS